MKISIIIPTYNRSFYILKTIESFVNQNYPKDSFELIIADNNSTDNTREIIEGFLKTVNGVKITYIFEGRQGVHYARNTAAKIAQHDLLYFTDDDMVADINLLSEIVKPFLFDENVGTATGRVLPLWETDPPVWIKKHCNNYLLSLLNPEYDFFIGKTIDFLYSCHEAVRKDVFFKAEGFNPEYTKGKYLGDGETGLNIKIMNLNYKFAFNGNSIIYHIIPASRFTQKYLNKRLENNGRGHAYTAFKCEKTRSSAVAILRILKIFFINFPPKLLRALVIPLIQKDISLYRFSMSLCYYYYGVISYRITLLKNHDMRRFVKKNDWLSNDSEFDTINL